MLSSKTYLALLIILELKRQNGNAPLTSNQLAKRYSISKRYLEVVFGSLAKSGIISSKRGIGGGYFLSSEVDQISLYDLAVAVEGGLRIFGGGDYLPVTGSRAGIIKGTNEFWDDMEKRIMGNLKDVMIGNLIKELASFKEMYFI